MILELNLPSNGKEIVGSLLKRKNLGHVVAQNFLVVHVFQFSHQMNELWGTRNQSDVDHHTKNSNRRETILLRDS
jgi:hypothetical protein